MLGIIILNYNTWKETVDCIQSVLNYPPRCIFKIYVIDNNSSVKLDKKQRQFFEEIENLELILLNNNFGYSAGNNVGIRYAIQDGCKLFLITNSDILFVDNSIQIMINYIESNHFVGIVGPQIFNGDGEFQPFYLLSKLTGSGKLKNMLLSTPFSIFFQRFKKTFILEKLLDQPRKVFSVSGCCFLINRKCLDIIFPLDENTFLYEEEYIIGSKLENSTWEAHIIPFTHVKHLHGISTKGMSPFAYDCFINSEQYYLKNYLKTNIFLRKIIYLVRKQLSLIRYGRL